MPNISVLLLAKNEENRIAKAINSVREFADEIVVIDDGSADKTRQVAEDLGAVVYERPLNGDFAGQYMFGFSKCSCEWIFLMDCDEIVPAETVRWVQQEVKRKGLPAEISAVSMKRLNHIWGRPLYYGGSVVDLLRLLKRGEVEMEGKVHSSFKVKKKTLRTGLFVNHYRLESVSAMVKKINNYTEIQCYEKNFDSLSDEEIKKRLIFRPIKLFWKVYIKKRGYKDGIPGLVWCFLINILNEELLYVKLLERRFKS